MAQGIWTPGGSFDRQPQGPVEIDWGNPIALGLFSSFYAGERKPNTTVNGTYTTNADGTVVRGSGGNKPVVFQATKNVGTGDYTYLVVHRPYTSASIGNLAVSMTDQSSNVWIGDSNGVGAHQSGGTRVLSGFSTAVNRLTVHAGTRRSGILRAYTNGRTGGATGTNTGTVSITSFSLGSYGDLGYSYLSDYAAAFAWSRALSDAEIASISANPWQLFRDDTSDALIFDLGGTAGPTVLVASPGALSLSGQANTFLRSLRLSADPGTLGLAGQAVTLVVGAVYPLASDPGALSLAGQVATLVVNRITPVLVADPGALSLAGQQVSTLYSRSVVANPGSLGLTGQAATLVILASNLLVANPGILSLAGQAAELVVNRVTPVLVASLGALALAGQQASTLATRLLVASPGSLSLAGQQATTAASRRLVADPGGFVLLGMAASLGNGLGVSNVYVKVGGAYVAASALRVKQGGVYVGGQAFVKLGGVYLPVMT